MTKQLIELIVNGHSHEVAVHPWQTLAEVLREELNLTGTKVGCNQGDCGACTVLLEGRSVSSCLTLAMEAHQRPITTIEGLAQSLTDLHPIQEAFVESHAVQCGFCSAGMIMSAKYLLDHNPHPSPEEIRQGLSGNLCRCTGYVKVVEAIGVAADKLGGAPAKEA
jgi:carbon-monoxide dehydrogenase small subunit